MKEVIRQEDVQRFKKMSDIFTALFFAMMLTPVPLLHYLDVVGIGIWVALSAACLRAGSRVEKAKKAFGIQTYKEIYRSRPPAKPVVLLYIQLSRSSSARSWKRVR